MSPVFSAATRRVAGQSGRDSRDICRTTTSAASLPVDVGAAANTVIDRSASTWPSTVSESVYAPGFAGATARTSPSICIPALPGITGGTRSSSPARTRVPPSASVQVITVGRAQLPSGGSQGSALRLRTKAGAASSSPTAIPVTKKSISTPSQSDRGVAPPPSPSASTTNGSAGGDAGPPAASIQPAVAAADILDESSTTVRTP